MAKKIKSGFVPFYREGSEILFLFMVPSDSGYGGTEPQIAKGEVDNESIKKAAIREAEEELGLKPENLKFVKFAWGGVLAGLKDSYEFTVYYGEVKSKTDFNKPHYETKSTHWLTYAEFAKQGRSTHLNIVKNILRKIENESD